MKTIRSKYAGALAITAALLLSATACQEDFLQEKVYDTLTPINFYKSEADIQAALISIYSTMRESNAWGRQIWLGAEYPGDATWPNNSGEAWRTELDQLNWTASSTGFKQIWESLYKMVNRANTVLQYIDVVTYNTDGTRAQIEAETRFLRGLAYLTLVRFFDHVPYVTEENMTDLYPTNSGTDDQVWTLIIEDFKFALATLPPVQTGDNTGRATAGAAQTMLAKAYLTRAGHPWNKQEYWAMAAEELNKIMNNSAYGYGLHEDYNDVFLLANEHGKEYIFSLELESGIGQGRDYPTFTGIRSGNQLRLDGWSSLTATEEFFDTMSEDDKRRERTFVLSYEDIRGNGTVYTYPETISLPHYNKFQDPEDVNGTGTADYAMNLPITRYADVLLMHSEAANEAGGPSPEAVKGINQVRARAGLDPINPAAQSKESLREAIVQERVWELCEEGHAYFDLKRQKALLERNQQYSPEERDYVFPIPQDEMDVNPNLVQNEGY